MTYTKLKYSKYEYRALTRDYGNHKDAMLDPNESSHNNNCIE